MDTIIGIVGIVVTIISIIVTIISIFLTTKESKQKSNRTR